MKIDGDTIIFNSDWPNYEAEENGKKPNTVRIMSRADAEEIAIWWQIRSAPRKIEMHGTERVVFEMKKHKFKRILTDARDGGDLLGHHIFIFSWKHEEKEKIVTQSKTRGKTHE